MRRFIYYVVLLVFIFVIPHSIGDTNLFTIKTVLFVLFFVAPVLKIVNNVGESVEKPIKKFKEIDEIKKDRFKI
jgi:hypothetical protein